MSLSRLVASPGGAEASAHPSDRSDGTAGPPDAAETGAAPPLRSVHTSNFPAILQELGISRPGHDLPGRQAGDAPPRRGPPQHALPRLQQADGPGRGRGSAGHRHERGDLGVSTTPRPWPASLEPAGSHDACFLPRSSVMHRRHPDPRDGLGQSRATTPSCGSSTRASPACVRGATPTASCRAGGRRSSRPWPRRTAAI